jgi:hypothetical protein
MTFGFVSFKSDRYFESVMLFSLMSVAACTIARGRKVSRFSSSSVDLVIARDFPVDQGLPYNLSRTVFVHLRQLQSHLC